MTAEPVRVGIVDDHDLFREGIASLLSRDGRIRVVGQAHDSQSALALVEERHPDVLLLDVSMPGDPARATIARIRRGHPGTRVVILTMHQDTLLHKELLASGAAAYLTKTAPSRELVETICRVAADEHEPVLPDAADDEGAQLLSNREHEVLRLIAQARSNRDIADELCIAEGTVKRHANSIYGKLGATSRIDATRKAVRLGILPAQMTLP